MRILPALFSALFGVWSFSAGAADAALSFRGIELGTRLADFKKLPAPTNKKNTKVLCTGDKEADSLQFSSVKLNNMLGTAGAKQCRFVGPAKYSKGRLEEVYLEFGSTTAAVSFLFTPPGIPDEAGAKLYFINLSPENRYYEPILNALTIKYGPPTETRSEEKLNRMGAKFQNFLSTWKVGGVILTVEKYGSRVDEMNITFLAPEMALAVDEFSSKLQGNIDAGKL